jgi:hypothetical protein
VKTKVIKPNKSKDFIQGSSNEVVETGCILAAYLRKINVVTAKALVIFAASVGLRGRSLNEPAFPEELFNTGDCI